LHLQRIGLCAAVFSFIIVAGAQIALSRPLAGGPAMGGFLLAQQGSVEDSTATQPLKTKNPTGALLRSLALPGWGQLYNEQYIKSALVLAAEGLLVAGAIVEHQRAEDDHAVYEDLSRSDAVREAAWLRYSRRVDKRNAYLWYYAGFKFLSLIDAYVDAHLYHFDEGPFGVEVRDGPEEGPRVAVVVRCALR